MSHVRRPSQSRHQSAFADVLAVAAYLRELRIQNSPPRGHEASKADRERRGGAGGSPGSPVGPRRARVAP